MVGTPAVAEIGALVGDPGRANMLIALLDGRALTAKEMAARAGITQQTASAHIAKLIVAGLIVMERQGSRHYHRLASADIARMLESMMCVAAGDSLFGAKDAALREARVCYDHLAGRLGVAVAESLVAQGFVVFTPDGGEVTRAGEVFFRDFGLSVDKSGCHERVFCRPCMDWSERRPHLTGVLGAELLNQLFARGWIRRLEGTRAVDVNAAGKKGFREVFGV